MKRCFIFKDGNSQKFWNIDVSGADFTVTYGKLGTAGQTTAKSFDTNEKCEKEADKLIAEKTKKGYTEVSEETVKSEKNEGKKYSFDYDSEESGAEAMAEKILHDKRLPDLKYITVGNWGEPFDESCQDIIDMFVKNKDKFQNLESLYVGDMDSEECEMSWICQGDYEKLLEALPNLKILKIQGQSPELGKIDHANLEELQIIGGGLSKDIIKSLKTSKLPKLETLVLYMGVEDYGCDCEVSDFAALAKKDLFPNLKYLGFLDSEVQDELVEAILNSDILPQLEVVDVSYGCLTDKGGQMILDAKDKLTHLKALNANYHFMTKEMMKQLKALPFEVNVGDPQDPDDDYISPMITE